MHLDPGDAPGLVASLGPVPERLVRYPLDRLVVGRRLDYEVRANWKVLAENYNECYHCAGVHPELVRLVPAFGRGGAGLDWDGGVPMRDGAWTFTSTGTTRRRPFAGLDPDEQVRHKGELIYPNLMISLSADHVAAFRLVAESAGRTRVECDILVDPAETEREDYDVSDAADFWDMVNRQDWAICESVQRGMSSKGYTQGWFAPMEDASLDIRRWLLPRLERG
ncbi:MAG: RHO alpha subunit C-terminal catalytic domain-containing protein [Actinomycetales bacterium]